jgi:hypothetical protein
MTCLRSDNLDHDLTDQVPFCYFTALPARIF